MLYHITPRVIYSTALASAPVTTGLDGQTLDIAVAGGEGITVNGGRIILGDTFTTAGVIHLVDKVMVPSKIPDNVPIPGSSTPTTSTNSATASTAAPTSPAKASTTPVPQNSGVMLTSSLLSAWLAIAAVFFM